MTNCSLIILSKIQVSFYKIINLDHYNNFNDPFPGTRGRGTFFNRGGFRGGRRGNMDDKRRGGRYNDNEREKPEYFDYDDPNQNKKSERHLTNYDALFD